MNSLDAIELLTDDHEKVKTLFEEFDAVAGDDSSLEEKAAIVQQICQELVVHTAIEEEIFYPAARAAIDDDDLIDEAIVEHASAKDLIEQLQAMTPDDDQYDANVTVLKEYIEHHVKEEEEEMFPKIRAAELDLEHYGEQMADRKEEMMAMPHMLGGSADAPTQPRPSR